MKELGTKDLTAHLVKPEQQKKAMGSHVCLYGLESSAHRGCSNYVHYVDLFINAYRFVSRGGPIKQLRCDRDKFYWRKERVNQGDGDRSC